MITLQHTLVTLLGLRGNERELDEEIQYVLLPDAIRRYCGPRQYSHFEKSYDGKEKSKRGRPQEAYFRFPASPSLRPRLRQYDMVQSSAEFCFCRAQ